MASGGGLSRSRQSSEGKKRSTWQNQRSSFSDRDDALSLNSLPSDVRINNWDFSDWRPNSSSVDSKRKKKSKGNPEREREQSLSLDSPPGEERKARTPSTCPRTKVTASTPPAQQAALENLRTHMTFSDFDDQASTDGEPNNERDLAARRRQQQQQQRGLTRPGAGGGGESLAQLNLAEPREERSTRNNIREGTPDKGPDSNQIVGRLMQIRDYIKQAAAMQDSLQNMGDASKREDVVKVKALIANLREQERGYLGLLQRTLHQGGGEGASNAVGGARGETDSDSLDLEVQSNASASSDSTSSRPRIEDKLGLETDEEATSRESALDNTLVAAHPTSAPAPDPDAQSLEENDAVSTNDNEQEELDTLRQQHNLLQILIEKQKQLKLLQERQNFLLAKQKDAEKRLAEATARDNQARAALEAAEAMTGPMGSAGAPGPAGPLKSNIVGYPESDDDESANARAPDNLPPDLLEMHNHLSYMRNELRHEEPERDTAPNNADSEASCDVLRDKLQALQQKKGRMDELLKELQFLQSQRREMIASEADAEPSGATAAPLPQPSEPTPAGEGEEEEEEEEEEDEEDGELDEHALRRLMDAQEKLRKLQEVRERLNQLRDLVQYYQGAKEGGEEEAMALSPPAQLAAMENLAREFEAVEQAGVKFPMQESSDNNNAASSILRRPRQLPDSQQSNEENASEAGTTADSQLSSLGPWGDDPELQDKVRKLMTAKERLRQLQELVNLVQQSPEAVNSLPAELAQLAASLEDESVGTGTQPLPDEPNISVSEGEIPMARAAEEPRSGDGGPVAAATERERQELESLRQERRRLLAIQDQLKSLQDQFNKEDNASESDEQNDTVEKVSAERSRQTHNAPVVTFASNDELYSKMRKQRMLREELRQKKKELEAIMRKDRNKRQYFRNQDNQSDTVSYSTDAFGASASADATMATWGGSTVDNLEHITEYDDRNAQAEDQDDDGYPSDGIVQVEEEEEENQSDNGTYTIEQDARQRRSARVQREMGQGARPKVLRKSQSFPQPLRDSTQPRPRGRRRMRPAPPPPVPQQESRGEPPAGDGGKEEELSPVQALQRSLEQTSQMCRALLLQQQTMTSGGLDATGGMPLVAPLDTMTSSSREGLSPSAAPHSVDRLLLQQQQLQQQQLLLNMNQCYQQLSLQQMETRSLQAQVNQLTMQLAATQGEGGGVALPPHVAPASTAASFNVQTSRQAVFTLNPHQFPYPDPFAAAEAARHPSLFDMGGLGGGEDEGADGGYRPPQAPPSSQRGGSRSLGGELGRSGDRGRDQTSIPSSRSSEQRRWGSAQNPHVAGIDQRRMPADSELGRRSGGSLRGTRSQALSTHPLRNPRTPPRNQETALDSFVGSELSLFDTLRETIYAEVATLISQNESRPQFLIELFRELQTLRSDQSRQRFLTALQDLRSKTSQEQIAFSPHREEREQQRPSWLLAGAEQATASEVTPSESLMTSEDEMFVRRSREPRQRGRARMRRAMAEEGGVPPGEFDYMEAAENTSSLSTPSNGVWESPFNQDSLGNTVINFDKELRKMREYERRKEEQRQRVAQVRRNPEVSSSSAMAQDSESSIPDADYSRIDLLQLDQLIKNIVAQVLPVIREHIEDVCSPQLLTYIQRIILMLTHEKNSEPEFSEFFQQSMNAIVQGILSKYEGRRMRDVKDDLVMDLSEVLFNEMAFFRLMQNLDPPSLADKVRARAWIRQSGGEERAALYRQAAPEGEEESDGNESSSEQSSESEASHPTRLRMAANEEDDLGKERDDELANDTTVRDTDDKDDDADRPYSGAVSIQLAVSETKPFTRIGSDEDDDDEDNSQSVEDPSETAVSRDAWRERSGPVGAPAEAVQETVTMETRGGRGSTQPSGGEDEEEEDLTPRNSSQPPAPGEQQEADGTAANLDKSGTDKPSSAVTASSDAASAASSASPDKASLPNGTAAAAAGNKSGSHSNGPVVNGEAEQEVTLDDLPSALNIPTPAGVDEKAREEERAMAGVEAILQTMDTGNELAGDPQALPNPDSFTNQRVAEPEA